MDQNPRVKAMFLQAVKDQLASPDSPEVRQEYDRLILQGVTDQSAREMIASILSFYMVRMMQNNAEFDYTSYVDELRRLPEIDYDAPL